MYRSRKVLSLFSFRRSISITESRPSMWTSPESAVVRITASKGSGNGRQLLSYCEGGLRALPNGEVMPSTSPADLVSGAGSTVGASAWAGVGSLVGWEVGVSAGAAAVGWISPASSSPSEDPQAAAVIIVSASITPAMARGRPASALSLGGIEQGRLFEDSSG